MPQSNSKEACYKDLDNFLDKFFIIINLEKTLITSAFFRGILAHHQALNYQVSLIAFHKESAIIRLIFEL